MYGLIYLMLPALFENRYESQYHMSGDDTA